LRKKQVFGSFCHIDASTANKRTVTFSQQNSEWSCNKTQFMTMTASTSITHQARVSARVDHRPTAVISDQYACWLASHLFRNAMQGCHVSVSCTATVPQLLFTACDSQSEYRPPAECNKTFWLKKFLAEIFNTNQHK